MQQRKKNGAVKFNSGIVTTMTNSTRKVQSQVAMAIGRERLFLLIFNVHLLATPVLAA